MRSSSRIPKYVEAFFKSCGIDSKINRLSFFMIRYDGVILHHNNTIESSHSKSSIGALLSGVWQASKALADFIPAQKRDEGFRLSFDTSDRGVYIVPINNELEELYLGLIYHDEINPGLIKNKMREMAASFSEFLAQELIKNEPNFKKTKGNDQSDFLFGEISDAEMDRLFAFVSN